MATVFKDYKIKADTYSLTLHPKTNPEDLDLLKNLYSDLENRLEGIEPGLNKCGVERLVLTITKRGGLADDI